MNADLQTNPAGIRRPTAIIILLMLAGCVLIQRFKLKDAPVQADMCAYAVIGHEMMHGRQLYSDLWERKPPLLYITYAAAELAVGYGKDQLFVLGLTASLVTLILIYQIGAIRGRTAGAMCAALWMLLNNDLHLAASQPDPEVFINCWLAVAFLLLVRWPVNRHFTAALLLGILLAAATLYKHNAALACAGMLAGHALVPRSRRLAIRLGESAVAAAVICVVWLAMWGYFAATHRSDAFIDVLFQQNASYAGSASGIIDRALKPSHLFPPFMGWAIAPLALLALLILFAIRNHQWPARGEWLLLLCWAVGTWPTVAVVGYLSPLYYQLWLPIGCIAGGWAGTSLIQRPMRVPPVLGYSAVIAAFGFLAFRQGTEFLLTPDQWIHRQFPDYDLAGENQLGRDLGRFLRPEESFWVFGDDNALYFFSGHSPPSGLLFIDPFLYGTETHLYWARLFRDLNRTQPALVVVSENSLLFPPDAPIFPWLHERYWQWETPLGWPHYRMLVRRGSELETRINPRHG